MPRLAPALAIGTLLCVLPWAAFAKPVPAPPSDDVIALMEQNRLVEEVARRDPADLWSLVRNIRLLVATPRDSGTARSGSRPTEAEAAQIAENPALVLANERDPAATLALLRKTNDDLGRSGQADIRESPKRIALVIGSSGDDIWGRLATTRNDAVLIASALARQGFAISGGAALIDPDKQRLLKSITEFIHAIGPDTVALFYYAGHGVQADGLNYIVPESAPLPQTDRDYGKDLVGVDGMVLRRMQQANARLSILMLDACRDNPLLAERGPVPASSTRRPAQGLAPMGASSAGGGAIIIYSTSPNSIARDRINGEADSPFASAFAATIAMGGLEIRDVFGRVEAAVDRATDHRQQPWISYSTGDTFYFQPAATPDIIPSVASAAEIPVCPPPGTTVTLGAGEQSFTGIYQPASPDDPTRCNVANANGEVRTLLYNIYDTSSIMNDAPVQTAFKKLLSGQEDRVNFSVFLKSAFPFRTYTETWTRLGWTDLFVNGRYKQVLVFDRDSQGARYTSYNAGNTAVNFGHDKWRLWYEPGLGVVKQSRIPVDTPADSDQKSQYSVISVSP